MIKGPWTFNTHIRVPSYFQKTRDARYWSFANICYARISKLIIADTDIHPGIFSQEKRDSTDLKLTAFLRLQYICAQKDVKDEKAFHP